MTPVVLAETMSPAQHQGWRVLLDLAKVFSPGWCLVGGQMVWLLAAEHGADPPRATDDVDLVVDIRAEPTGISDLCHWLENKSFDLAGISPDGIGHRYVRAAAPGPGSIMFDVLAPDNIGARADLATTQGARTIEAAGSRRALNNCELVEVSITGATGQVVRPTLNAAIVLKATATTIPTRAEQDLDLSDVAFLLSLVPDPIEAARNLSKPDRKQLRAVSALLDEQHGAWRPLGRERARLGQTALDIMLNPES
jgi:hypothetical protein